MRNVTVVFVAAVAMAVAPLFGDYYIAGDFNGWNPAGTAMTDLGSGIWQANLTGVGGRHEFKVTTGSWDQNWPGSGNSWFFGDGDGKVTITFNANDIQDGWRGNWGRMGLSTDPGTWTAVGDWQGWNNANPATAMVAQGGGIYKYQQTLAPGWYQWKAVVTGSWDAIGDDFRGVNANTTWFEVTAANPTAVFQVDALTGIIRVDVVPEPAAVILVLVGGLLCLRRRRS
ncbi:MAG TPA: PEP-CTERM sorting domain-containing protein [Phycisphaerae bacterium]|nr:PEP-CTERM sorting domain-containing protein [Phycisphaerae bacterium]HRR83616.1 PEP-CTERM sorting domain-containing protein [Phycisphaerae bacterium]